MEHLRFAKLFCRHYDGWKATAASRAIALLLLLHHTEDEAVAGKAQSNSARTLLYSRLPAR